MKIEEFFFFKLKFTFYVYTEWRDVSIWIFEGGKC